MLARRHKTSGWETTSMAILKVARRTPSALCWIVLALAMVAGCEDASQSVGRDPGAVNADDDAPEGPEDDDESPPDGDDADDDAVDAARPKPGKADAGSDKPREDAAKPPPTVDGSADTDGDAALDPSDAATDEGSSDASVASDAAAPGEERADLGKGDGKDVVTIGDSWMLLLGTGIQESLTRVSGQPYRKYARPGTRLLDGVIPGQYATAKRADPDIKTVVMTGGGNDIIQNSTLKSDCMRGGAMCDEQVAKIRMRLAELWKEMSTDGVQDVIHVMYSKSAGSGVMNRDKHNEQMAEVCAAVPAPLRCHLLNTDELIGPSDMRGDGIHPTDSGYDKIGKAVFELMEEEGMRR